VTETHHYAITKKPGILKAKGYISLTKPRIIELLLVTTLPTMILAYGSFPPIKLVIWTLFGGTLAAGGANAFNMILDRDIDSLMKRTANRPLVTGIIGVTDAVIFAVCLEIAAFFSLWLEVNLLSGLLAVAATAFYVLVYTMLLKRRSSQNIVIGGAAGAVPVLIGWSSVTNSISWAAIVLFLFIFFWTPPHFWALAIKYDKDYAVASVPMRPCVVSIKRTSAEIIIYSLLVSLSALSLPFVSKLNWTYDIISLLASLGLLCLAIILFKHPSRQNAMKLFHFSITYVILIFAAIALDVLIKI
jgi:protoheme IX farnesyltransferase